ncbi:GNAT family N-acetyltransferase [Clostridium sp. Cult2]|uniref:GNAT family N-acetyltransferase n=1 Tax=Clostridium sp. Cult2 TaxID=2079003 RepID=UPI001F2E9E46|nr:GNAT family N-acetyltransferase [Clostridium sp. Cult2]
MNRIKIKEDIIPEMEEVMNLYEDVEWYVYTKERVRLKNAINNSLKVLTAWDNDKLVGLIRVVGDNHTIIYIQDILILKEYQG